MSRSSELESVALVEVGSGFATGIDVAQDDSLLKTRERGAPRGGRELHGDRGDPVQDRATPTL